MLILLAKLLRYYVIRFMLRSIFYVVFIIFTYLIVLMHII